MDSDDEDCNATNNLLDDVEKALNQDHAVKHALADSNADTYEKSFANKCKKAQYDRSAIFTSCLLSFICGLAVAILFQAFSTNSPVEDAVFDHSSLSHDVKSISPLSEEWRESLVPRLFMRNERFHPDERTATTEEAWAELYERYVLIDRPERLNLPPSEPHPFRMTSEAYAIAAFHQTHCLTTLRYAWYKATAPPNAIAAYRPTNLAANVTLEQLEYHARHCFDYIRQSIQCCADSTLEPFLYDDGISPMAHGSSGYGTVHQCRNFNGLATWIEDNRLTDFDPPDDGPRRKSEPLDFSLIEPSMQSFSGLGDGQ